MALKKHILRKSKNSKKYKKSKNSKNSRKYRKSKTLKKFKYQKGGFGADCNLATVREPAFSIPSLGSIDGFNISSARGAIFRPNCKADTYQAMKP